MTSITRALNDYFSNIEKDSIQSNYNKHNNTKAQISIEDKNRIIGILYNNEIKTLLNDKFKIDPHPQSIGIMGGGTQGFVIKFNSNKIKEAFNGLKELKTNKRVKGPYFESELTYIKKIALKIQLLDTESSFYEKRTIKEESIMHYLNDLDPKPDTKASIIKNAIPKFYFGCTLGYELNEKKYYFRLSFMELLDSPEYISLQNFIGFYKNGGGRIPENRKDLIYNNIENIVKTLWRFKVTHNDLSIANIFLCLKKEAYASVKLIDFGLAQMINPVHKNINSEDDYSKLFILDKSGTNVDKLKDLHDIIYE